MFGNLREDLKRYGERRRDQLIGAVTHPGAWAVVAYRFRHWVHTAPLPRPLRRALKVPSAVVDVAIRVATNIELPEGARIGPGLLVAHSGYVVISSDVTLGSHCTLTQGVTLGHAAGTVSPDRAAPVIGNRVYIGPGASVVGRVTVGDDSVIGVGAVVTRSVPACAVVVGNPGRVVSTSGSFELIRYPKMDHDSDRLRALMARDSGANGRSG